MGLDRIPGLGWGLFMGVGWVPGLGWGLFMGVGWVPGLGGGLVTAAARDLGLDLVPSSTSGALVHVDGFEHSPFECSFECCHRDLYSAVFVYTMIFTNFDGGHPTIEGEPYVAIEPYARCP